MGDLLREYDFVPGGDYPPTEEEFMEKRNEEMLALPPDESIPEGVPVIVKTALDGPFMAGLSPAKETAKRLVELVKEGHTPEQAASMMGHSFKNLLHTKGIKDAMTHLVMEHHLPPQVQREIVRAARIKVLAHGLAEEDSELVLKAAKQIASDPDVGLTAPPVPPVTIDLRDLKDVLENIKPMPGFEEEENDK